MLLRLQFVQRDQYNHSTVAQLHHQNSGHSLPQVLQEEEEKAEVHGPRTQSSQATRVHQRE